MYHTTLSDSLDILPYIEMFNIDTITHYYNPILIHCICGLC